MSKIEVNTVEPQCGTTLTLGACGQTVALGSGASQTGFGRTGTVDWQTGSIKTTTFTAANGEGYFANTVGGGFTMNLPAGVVGNIVSVVDYTNTFQTNNLTISPDGSEKIGGINANVSLSTEGQSVTFVYVDGTEGWKNVQDSTSNVTGRQFLAATVSGACNSLITSGDYKTAVFKGPGTFTVCQVSSSSSENTVDYFVVAGGGGGGFGAAGAGGFRLYSTAPGCNSPLNNYGASPNTEVTVTATAYPIAVGGGGAGTAGGPAPYCSPAATPGVASSFSSVTSAGGGGAGVGCSPTPAAGLDGGSGGGAGYNSSGGASVSGGSGNTPPVSPSQGSNGGSGQHVPGVWAGSGGGGGAGAVGTDASPGGTSPGGIGSYIADSLIGPTAPSYGTAGPVSSTRYFAGGGGGQCGTGGSGGGGNYHPNPVHNGVTNTGGGGGGGYANPPGGATGGSGIVMIRYKFQ
jgi:hypothetical protein